eukprot:4336264-Prymnesium_polylepis.1
MVSVKRTVVEARWDERSIHTNDMTIGRASHAQAQPCSAAPCASTLTRTYTASSLYTHFSATLRRRQTWCPRCRRGRAWSSAAASARRAAPAPSPT